MLAIYGEGTRLGSTLCSTARARHSLQHGCMGFLAYAVDTRVEKKGSTSTSHDPVVCDFPDVFPKELPSVPPERQMEFQFELIPGVASISKAPYHLAPTEMQVLPSQL